MKNLYKILTTAYLIATLEITNCGKPQKLGGIVKEEFGTVNQIVSSDATLFSNETIKFGDPTYGLVIESNGKIYNLQVKEHFYKPLLSLAKTIECGDSVSIILNLIEDGQIYEDGTGMIRANTITIIKK